jgi:hypothetical protein
MNKINQRWEQFTAEAERRGCDVRVAYHTDSGIWHALDRSKAPARVPLGQWTDVEGGTAEWLAENGQEP